MIEVETKRNLHEAISEMKQVQVTGGSTSNTMHGIAHLGGEVGFVGKVGMDKMGRFFEEDMGRSGIQPHLIHAEGLDTGVATTLMSGDAERTFATYLGAASTMTAQELDAEVFKGYDYVHVEGYLIFNHDLILHVCQMAKQAGLTISMDMASFNLVEEHRDFVAMLLKDYVDIIFANEDEARAFACKEGEEALDVLSQYCRVAVVKMGGRGSVAQIDGQRLWTGTNGCKPVDTNGAGDAYAAGFLYGLMNQLPAEKIMRLAASVGDEAVATVGAKLSENQWNKIKKEHLLS